MLTILNGTSCSSNIHGACIKESKYEFNYSQLNTPSGEHSVSSKCVVNMDGFGILFQKVEIKSCGSSLNPETSSLFTACLMVL
jgi:hypothetical protein